MSTNRYLERGVSSKKEDVHNAIKNIDKGLFKNSFCKVIPDILSNDTSYCNIMHADGAGTKSALAYLYWKETNDISVWRGIAHDALIMNIDDLIAVGVTDNFVMSSTIGRNKHLIPGEVISEIIEGNNDMISLLNENNINISSSGGETADVGDITKTILVDSTIVAREKRSKIIECKIKPGNIIVGLSSCGKSSYEDIYNSGIGSNGLTSARHDVLCSYYKENFPETYSKETKDEFIYCGSKRLTDKTESELNIGKSLLSPTRTYAPIIKKVLKKNKENISAIIHCTGGGQTKVLHFTESNRIIKDNLFEIPDIFKIIKNESMCSYKEMYSVFNMGHRMEIYCDKVSANSIMEISETFNVEAKVIGRVEKSEKKELIIENEEETIEF
ncbi:MAG: AIR synthase-related protein [Cytophagales bacterium]